MSGPKRYDWVVRRGDGTGNGNGNGKGIDKGRGNGKERGNGGGEGEWVYLRDGSTLSGLLEEEVGVVVAGEEEGAGS